MQIRKLMLAGAAILLPATAGVARGIQTPTTQPPPPLRTPGTADSAEAARQVREVIDRAAKGLASVDYGRISRERRTQYDNAKLFIQQAEEAIKQSNYVYARELADKADRIARELQGR